MNQVDMIFRGFEFCENITLAEATNHSMTPLGSVLVAGHVAKVVLPIKALELASL